MALYAIGDPHLSLGKGTDKSMTVFSGWDGYVDRLEKNWRQLVTPEDTVVLPGDISWGMSLQQAYDDFAFLNQLPGQKLILKGNHDYWWTTRRKMDAFLLENGLSTLRIVHNDAVEADGLVVCGTRGWFFDAEEEEDVKVLRREVGRLRASLTAARSLNGEPVVFLHYPPIYGGQTCPEFLDVLKEFSVKRCYYGHVHSVGIRQAFNGERDGVQYRLISADALDFCPVKIFPAE